MKSGIAIVVWNLWGYGSGFLLVRKSLINLERTSKYFYSQSCPAYGEYVWSKILLIFDFGFGWLNWSRSFCCFRCLFCLNIRRVIVQRSLPRQHVVSHVSWAHYILTGARWEVQRFRHHITSNTTTQHSKKKLGKLRVFVEIDSFFGSWVIHIGSARSWVSRQKSRILDWRRDVYELKSLSGNGTVFEWVFWKMKFRKSNSHRLPYVFLKNTKKVQNPY